MVGIVKARSPALTPVIHLYDKGMKDARKEDCPQASLSSPCLSAWTWVQPSEGVFLLSEGVHRGLRISPHLSGPREQVTYRQICVWVSTGLPQVETRFPETGHPAPPSLFPDI